MKYVATAAHSVVCTGDLGTAQAVLQSQPSANVLLGGSGVLAGQMTYQVTGSTISGAIQTAPVLAIIDPSAQYTRVDGQAVCLEGDQVQITISGETTTVPPVPASWPLVVKIQSAGQRVMSAE